MEIIKNIEFIWDNGKVSPFSKNGDEIFEFRTNTGSSKVDRLRWLAGNQLQSCNYPCEPLVDLTGVVAYKAARPDSAGHTCLLVINADGSLRCEILVPRVNSHSKPELGWMELPGNFAHLGIAWGVPGNDGNGDKVFEFDWATGQLRRWVNAPFLRY